VLDTGVVNGLPSFSLPDVFDPSPLLPFNVCLKPPNKFRLGFGELREDADDDFVADFELSEVEQGPEDDFGNIDICFLPDDGVDALLDIPCDLLSTGKLKISGAELQHVTNYSIITPIAMELKCINDN